MIDTYINISTGVCVFIQVLPVMIIYRILFCYILRNSVMILILPQHTHYNTRTAIRAATRTATRTATHAPQHRHRNTHTATYRCAVHTEQIQTSCTRTLCV